MPIPHPRDADYWPGIGPDSGIFLSSPDNSGTQLGLRTSRLNASKPDTYELIQKSHGEYHQTKSKSMNNFHLWEVVYSIHSVIYYFAFILLQIQ